MSDINKHDVQRMDISEFRSFGYLLGLALEVLVDDETGEESLGGIWDYRDDPEGIIFTSKPDSSKAVAVRSEEQRRREEREALMGSMIQPLDWEPVDEDESE